LFTLLLLSFDVRWLRGEKNIVTPLYTVLGRHGAKGKKAYGILTYCCIYYPHAGRVTQSEYICNIFIYLFGHRPPFGLCLSNSYQWCYAWV